MLTLPGLPRSLYYGNLVNRASPLNRGRDVWCLCLPQRGRGDSLLDIAGARHGAFTNGAAWGDNFSRPGGFGSLRVVAASDQYVLGPSVVGPAGGFSCFCWAMPITSGTYFFASQYEEAANTAYFQFFTTGTNIHARIHQTRDTAYIGRSAPVDTLTINAWQHVGFTWNGGTTNASIAIYRNGVAVDTADDSAGAFTAANTSAIPIRLGAQGTGSFESFDGHLDDFRFADRPTSAAHLYDDSRRGNHLTLNRLSTMPLFDVGGGGGGGNRRRSLLSGGSLDYSSILSGGAL